MEGCSISECGKSGIQVSSQDHIQLVGCYHCRDERLVEAPLCAVRWRQELLLRASKNAMCLKTWVTMSQLQQAFHAQMLSACHLCHIWNRCRSDLQSLLFLSSKAPWDPGDPQHKHAMWLLSTQSMYLCLFSYLFNWLNWCQITDDAQGQIEDCTIYANRGHGVCVTHGGHPKLSRCTIRDGSRRGLYCNNQVFDHHQCCSRWYWNSSANAHVSCISEHVHFMWLEYTATLYISHVHCVHSMPDESTWPVIYSFVWACSLGEVLSFKPWDFYHCPLYISLETSGFPYQSFLGSLLML